MSTRCTAPGSSVVRAVKKVSTLTATVSAGVEVV